MKLSTELSMKSFKSNRLVGNVVHTSVPILRLSRRDGCIRDTVIKVNIAKAVKLHVRDIKELEEVGHRLIAQVHAHENAIVLSLEGVKMMILRDEALVFLPDSEPAKRVYGAVTAQFDDFTTLKFEHELFETVLNVVVIILTEEFAELFKFVEEISAKSSESTETEQIIKQAALYPKKTKAQLLRKRVEEVIRELSSLQSDDVQLGMMSFKDPSDATTSSGGDKRRSVQLEPRTQSTVDGHESHHLTVDTISTANSSDDMETTPSPSGLKSKSVRQRFIDAPEVVDNYHKGIESAIALGYRPSDVGAYRTSAVDANDEPFRPSITLRAAKGPGGGMRSPRQNAGGSNLRGKKRMQSIVPTKLRDSTFDVELILDNALMSLSWLESDLDDLMDKITTLEAETALQVDIVRNRIMRYNTYLAVATFSVALAGLVPGIFGMNLLFPSLLYDDGNVFLWVVSMIAVAVPAVIGALIFIGKATLVL